MKSAIDYLPPRKTLSSLKKAARNCHGCPLYKKATQTVFGEGTSRANLMIVGEIPGNKEDISGRPFQGPAGTLLRDTLEKTGMDVEKIYFTNVVKHFKFTFLNNKRMHRSPVASEIRACLPWLSSEIEVIQPKIIICLGATAAKTLIGKTIKLHIDHGKWFDNSSNSRIIATFHPSAILRTPNKIARHQMKDFFLKDLKKAMAMLYKEDKIL